MSESDPGRPVPTQFHDVALPSIEDAPRVYRYLTLDRLNINDLPPHSDIPIPRKGNTTSLSQFLNNIILEASKIDFDEGFTSHGKWHPAGMNVAMPVLTNVGPAEPGPKSIALAATVQTITKPVPVSVDLRVKVMNKVAWVARRSYHLDSDVKYSELDNLLSQDHSRNEARYTPSVYDANELLAWSAEDLDKAVRDINRDGIIQRVQMSVFQMFHMMPKLLGGLSLLQDRVFHVLVITVHSTCPADANAKAFESCKISQSCTIQLPIDFESLSNVQAVMQKSRIKKDGSTRRYSLPTSTATDTAEFLDTQKQRTGNKLTEGIYVSVERLQKALKEVPAEDGVSLEAQYADKDYQHRWDMMTVSTAKGITQFAPERVKQTETLKAVAEDVYGVIQYVARARQNEQNRKKQ
ncbi:hypothetical protein BKA66DRAFT_26427 [Pyrenochaeta sp. MPI-SDFR-AT-0127]|nr:hypothetical protein BKA66DRAFT_26427 [Pyrenochaeta sp. MPI-SDFR-AT-0127]